MKQTVWKLKNIKITPTMLTELEDAYPVAPWSPSALIVVVYDMPADDLEQNYYELGWHCIERLHLNYLQISYDFISNGLDLIEINY